MKVKKIVEKVVKALEEHPEYRNNDNKLIATIWFYELKKLGNNPRKMNAFQLLQMYANKELPSAESIRRARQKLQAQYPEKFAGKITKDRKKELENETKEDLKSI